MRGEYEGIAPLTMREARKRMHLDLACLAEVKSAAHPGGAVWQVARTIVPLSGREVKGPSRTVALARPDPPPDWGRGGLAGKAGLDLRGPAPRGASTGIGRVNAHEREETRAVLRANRAVSYRRASLAPLRVMAAMVPHAGGAALALWMAPVRLNEAAILGLLILLGMAIFAGVLLDERYLALRRSGTRQAAAALRARRERAPAGGGEAPHAADVEQGAPAPRS